MTQYQREEAIEQNQAQGQVGEDMIGMGGPVGVAMKCRKQHQVLLRHDHHQAQEESDRERGRESFEDEGTEDGHGELDDGRPYRRHLES